MFGNIHVSLPEGSVHVSRSPWSHVSPPPGLKLVKLGDRRCYTICWLFCLKMAGGATILGKL